MLLAALLLEALETGEPFPVVHPHGAITGADAPAEARASCAVVLGEELGLYPPAFVQRARLRRIVLCRDLAFDGRLRAAIPDFGHATPYLDVLRGAEDAHCVRRTIHCELFHVVDWQDDGRPFADPAWAKRDAEGFRYGTGGADVRDHGDTCLWTESAPGFLSARSRSHPREVAAPRELAARFSPSVDERFRDVVARLGRPVPRRAPEGG